MPPHVKLDDFPKRFKEHLEEQIGAHATYRNNENSRLRAWAVVSGE
jgi:hypothetical protein